jgi:hypothetical protein
MVLNSGHYAHFYGDDRTSVWSETLRSSCGRGPPPALLSGGALLAPTLLPLVPHAASPLLAPLPRLIAASSNPGRGVRVGLTAARGLGLSSVEKSRFTSSSSTPNAEAVPSPVRPTKHASKCSSFASNRSFSSCACAQHLVTMRLLGVPSAP